MLIRALQQTTVSLQQVLKHKSNKKGQEMHKVTHTHTHTHTHTDTYKAKASHRFGNKLGEGATPGDLCS